MGEHSLQSSLFFFLSHSVSRLGGYAVMLSLGGHGADDVSQGPSFGLLPVLVLFYGGAG